MTEVDGLIMGLQTMDVVASLLSKRDNWSTLKTNIESIKTDVDGLTNETWVGKAKDQYLKLLPTQSNSLVEMAGLAKSQSTACDNVALINAQMFVAVKDGLSQLWDYVNANRNSRAIDWGAEPIGGVNCQDQQYVFRSRALEAKLIGFRDWLTEQSDADLADWSNPSTSLNKGLAMLAAPPAARRTKLGRTVVAPPSWLPAFWWHAPERTRSRSLPTSCVPTLPASG